MATAEMAIDTDWLTTTDVCAALGCAGHQARRVLDALARDGALTVLRAVRLRLVRRADLPAVRAELVRRGWLRSCE